MGQAKRIEVIAAACHEVNRTYCESIGDNSQPPWSEAPNWQKLSAKHGVKAALGGATPEQLHTGWVVAKTKDGWVYGTEKDPEKKTHPCMVPYGDLEPEQRTKDDLFGRTARELGAVLKA